MIVARKGRLEEIFSKALYTDEDPNNYTVSYRDLDSVVEVPLPELIAKIVAAGGLMNFKPDSA